ncbi:MAG: hypothetical protein KC416_17510, partial [Myxococcales bacterium]|nr:hypothetical protein [Myxococcales bacterium]
MLRIDFYAQHLVKNNAQAILLVSNQPATFQFAAGPRKSNSPVAHEQLVQLIQEVAPPEAIEQLRNGATCQFIHSLEGQPVTVAVRPANATTWQVQLRKAPPGTQVSAGAGGAAAAAAPAPTPEPPKEKEDPHKPVPVPRIELAPGEPGLNLYLRQMAAVKASDLHMSSTMPPMVRLDGEMKVL